MAAPPSLDITPAEVCCPPLAAQALAQSTAGRLAPMFKALSDPIRLRLLSLIASTREICVCDLTDGFEVSGATISHHLRVLREAGLVESERRGTWVYYRMRKETLDLLGGLLRAPTQNPSDAASRADDQGDARQRPGIACSPRNQEKLISAKSDLIRLLADPLRAELVRILAGGPACTSHLVAETGAKQPNVSGHLKQLREAGVVVTEPRGRFTYYRLVPDSMRGAALHLADLAALAHANAGNFRDR